MSLSELSSKVIIFDWDDTICPSSFVDQYKVENFKDLPLHYQNLFNEVGKCAEKCLGEATKYGEVIIITNSDDGWVKYSAERYVPNLLPVIPKYRIVSARTRYERFYPGQPLCWKAAAFAHEVNEHFVEDEDSVGDRARGSDSDPMNTSCESLVSTDESSVGSNSSLEGADDSGAMSWRRKEDKTKPVDKVPVTRRREIISFGDSMEERTAVKIVSGQLSAVPKSVMFIGSPTPLQLIGQLIMLTAHMKFVCENKTDLDLEISPQQAKKCAEDFLKKNKSAAQEQQQHTGSFFSRLGRIGA
uniref:Uncharacterized protein n=1 Tax=Helicotheca tamesis TaxID=374047 RepID=A0A7S2MJS3_9STRA|mmetsp:Transcript_17079/g.23463  ORF Transcript_17079/g.23463 Transcript_17079/m.23463 type:complete len:301 (+) Transcript_17079:40-942(+)